MPMASASFRQLALFPVDSRKYEKVGSLPLRKFSRKIPDDGGRTAMWLYPGEFSRSPELIKQLLLYFDGGVATIGASWDRTEVLRACPWLAEPLANEGLLHVIDHHQIYGSDELFAGYDEDETTIWGWYTTRLCLLEDAMEGAPEVFPRYVSRGKTQEARLKRGSVCADIDLASTVAGKYLGNGVQIAPVTAQEKIAALYAAHNAQRPPTKYRHPEVPLKTLNPVISNIVLRDLACVDLDLSRVPLPDILQFRREFGTAFARYSSDVRRFALELLQLPPGEQSKALKERHIELQDRRADLGRDARSRLRVGVASILSFLAGIASVAEHAPITGVLTVASAAASVSTAGSCLVWSTYLADASSRFPRTAKARPDHSPAWGRAIGAVS
jgi:hypothetical protein